jgi:hypothetical protein
VFERWRLDGAHQTVSGTDWIHAARHHVLPIEPMRLKRRPGVVVGVVGEASSISCGARSVVVIPTLAPFDAAQDVKSDTLDFVGGGRPKGCAPTLSGTRWSRGALADLKTVEPRIRDRHYKSSSRGRLLYTE